MATIPYSVRSFKALAERESRRGADLSRTVPAVKEAVAALHARGEQYKIEVMPLASGSPARLAARDQFRSDRKELRQNRDTALEDALQEALSQFEQALESGSFTYGLMPAVKLRDRQTYRVSDTLDVASPQGRQLPSFVISVLPTRRAVMGSCVRSRKLWERNTHTPSIGSTSRLSSDQFRMMSY